MEIAINQYWIAVNFTNYRVVKVTRVTPGSQLTFEVIENNSKKPTVFNVRPDHFRQYYAYLGTTLKDVDNVKEEYPEHFI